MRASEDQGTDSRNRHGEEKQRYKPQDDLSQ